MKKWIAAFLGILLILSVSLSASAEEQEIPELDWEVYASTIDESGIEATYVLLGDTGVAAWIPDAFLWTHVADEEEEADAEKNEDSKEDPDDEELDEEVIAVFGPEDESAVIEVTIPEIEEGADLSWDAMVRRMSAKDEDDQGEYLIGRVRVNGMDGLYMQSQDGTIGMLVVEYEPQKYMKFTFWPISDPGMLNVFDLVSASIQKVEVEE